MPSIHLSTRINAPVETCFNLARSVDVHMASTAKTNEKAIAGRTSGLCEENDEITWEAIHFGIKQNLSVRITKMEFPFFFEDEMLKGAFRSMKHRHYFKSGNDHTVMTDEFNYTSPLGWLGRLADILFLEKYMRSFLILRNQFIKSLAENQE